MVKSLSSKIQDPIQNKEASLERTGNHLNITAVFMYLNHICRKGTAMLCPYRVVYLPENSCKYLKLVNHTASKRTEWSYKESCKIGITFYLHWAMNEDLKKGLSEEEINKRLARKEKDAKKAVQGDRILLCQNHYNHGHRVTHVVETVSSIAEKRDEMWTREVKIVWVTQEPWEKYAPQTKNVIGDFLFKGGNLTSTNAPSIILNLDALK